ncbi:MAG: type II toxin-antitoxin system VapC family toxin [bacterium]|nr:type II toxin-antitoxin system VapC family toxin [bacterium]MDE0287638.1 type II toxin-antitoxin system VapC family toxin [bacterium]MDE0438397.1 type II toxin-antitoxin system VapC family toxin [bacterium]
MTAVDTNVLVRYLVRDDAAQAEAARVLLEGLTRQHPGFVCREVAIEVVWVLERAYRFERAEIADVLLELVATDCLMFESVDDVIRSVLRYHRGEPGFSDLMILAAAERAEALPLHTLDRRLARMEEATLVPTGPS